MRTPIIAGQTLSAIEKNIENEISQCEFWGDLELSFDEMEVIKERFNAVLARESVTVSYVCKHYPHAVTTFMVFFVRYKYDINFWGALGDELGIEITLNQHSEIGACAKKMFRKYGMDISDTKDEPHQIIAPIIYEACLPPESSLDDLFYVLSYDTYKVFDPQLIIDELIEMRSYRIRMPMFRFLSRFKDDRALDFVLEVRDAMITADQHNSRPSRYLGNYTDWKEKEKSRAVISDRKNQEFQTRPYLSFDNGNKGLCIILPRVVMATEWIEEVAWTIQGSNGFSRTIYCRVLGDEGRRYTDTITVAVAPSSKYEIHMDDTEGLDDKTAKNWEIEGIPDEGILCFNANGRQVNSNNLISPYGIMIIPNTVKILKTNSLDISDQYYPTNIDKYRIVSVTPLGSDAVFEYKADGSSYKLAVRPQINLSLEGDTLFSVDSSCNIFTSVPKLHINIEGNIMSGGFELRIGKNSYDVDLSSETENVYDLGKIAKKEIVQYGTYGVRLYQLGRFVKQIEFSYVPNVKTNYTSMIEWLSVTARKGKKTFKFNRIAEWEMEFERCTVTRDEKHYMIEVPSHVGAVPMVLKSMREDFVFKCEMDLPVHPYEAEIIDGDGNLIENITDKAYKVGIDWMLENEKWLAIRTYGDYRGRNYKVRLKTANGVEQTEFIRLTQNGAGNLNLSVFDDTLRNCPLPAEIEIVCEDKEELSSPLVIATEKLAMEAQVRFTIKESNSYISLSLEDDGKDIDVTRFGFHRSDVHIPYSESVLGKSGKTRGYVYPGVLEEGIYVISGSKEQAVFEFEEDDTVDLTAGNNVILVSCRGKKPVSTTKEWIDLLVKDVLLSGPNEGLAKSGSFQLLKSSHELDRLEKVALDDRDIEKLVALSYLVNGKIVNTKKEEIRKCMRLISSKLMRRGDRYRIIELLAILEPKQEIFDTCIDEYALLLFYTDRVMARELAGRIDNYSIELSMLLSMSTDGSIRDCVWREKYRDLIGRDAIKKLLSVPGTEDRELISNEQKKFFREEEGCRIKINLDDEIAGTEDAIQGMIVWDTKHPRLDTKKKPEYGVYFGRIKYVDQYVNWYKNTHDRMGNMNPEKHQMMVDVVKRYANDINKAYTQLAKDRQLSGMSIQYKKAVHARCTAEGTTVSYPRFFYMQGLAAFLAKLPVYREDLDGMRNIGIRFMEVAYIIAPRLSRRDILMAETYRYLKRKEEILCR